jgi:hypothetical protein
MLTVSDKKTKTGELGERIVAKYFRDQGCKVEESLNLFDSKKDMMIDGLTCEVKSQQPWHSENAFSIKPYQLKKCKSVDRLFFVETPSKYNQQTKIYELDKENRIFYKRNARDGREMLLVKKTKCKLLTIIEEHIIVNQFKEYSVSSWS